MIQRNADMSYPTSGNLSPFKIGGPAMNDEIFTISARRCKRCGGLLTSSQGIRDGYGPCCLKKIQEERARKEMEKYQCSLFDADGTEGDGNGN